MSVCVETEYTIACGSLSRADGSTLSQDMPVKHDLFDVVGQSRLCAFVSLVVRQPIANQNVNEAIDSSVHTAVEEDFVKRLERPFDVLLVFILSRVCPGSRPISVTQECHVVAHQFLRKYSMTSRFVFDEYVVKASRILVSNADIAAGQSALSRQR